LDEWKSVLFAMPPRVMSDIMQSQGIGPTAPPTVVGIPSFSEPAGPNGSEPGTDQPERQDTVPAET
jgi:hypothetical protein